MKGVIYARYSSANQREENIEGQLRECKEYAERNDIMILGTYIDLCCILCCIALKKTFTVWFICTDLSAKVWRYICFKI